MAKFKGAVFQPIGILFYLLLVIYKLANNRRTGMAKLTVFRKGWLQIDFPIYQIKDKCTKLCLGALAFCNIVYNFVPIAKDYNSGFSDLGIQMRRQVEVQYHQRRKHKCE